MCTLAHKYFNKLKSIKYWEWNWNYELFSSEEVLDVIYTKESTTYVFIDNSKLSVDLFTAELSVF